MPKTGYSEEDLANLSPEEREALDFDVDGDGATNDDDDTLGAPPPEGDGVKTPEGDEVKTPAPANDDDAPDATAAPFVPKFAGGEMPEDLKTRLTELTAKFNEGEITIDEFLGERDQIKDEATDRNVQAQLDQQAAERQQTDESKAKTQWKEDADTFMADPANEDLRKSSWLFGQVDAEVRRLSRDQDVVGKVSTGEMKNADVFALAKKNVIDGMQIALGTTARGPGNRPPAIIPSLKTLGDLPPAAQNNTGESRFAYLDALDGPKYEEALNKLSEADRDAYLAAG
jgi:hypothetical protein